MKRVRRLGIALGALVAAWLIVWLVGGWILGQAGGGIIATFAVVVLGAFIYRDIVRREIAPD